MDAILRGKVDRVDGWKQHGNDYYRVVDYKTGKKEFDYCDVFNGVGLQMLLYLFALEQEGEQMLGSSRIAAGVQYFPARVPYISLDGADESEEKDRRANWKRRGLLLNDEVSLKAMDPEEGMPRLSCKAKKDGNFLWLMVYFVHGRRPTFVAPSVSSFLLERSESYGFLLRAGIGRCRRLSAGDPLLHGV
jgi:ATP-dependent helicase/DNAse subunit B